MAQYSKRHRHRRTRDLGAFWVVLARLAMASLEGGAAGSPARACPPARAQAASPGDPSLIAIARPSRTVRSLGEVASLVVDKTPIKGTLTRTNQHEAFATNCVILASHPNERVGCH